LARHDRRVAPSYPFTRRQALFGALALLLALALGGRWLMRPDASADALAVQPVAPAATSEATTAEPTAEVVVDVVGAVVAPGLYRLEEGSRVADAVALAGGATRKANVSAVNLAAPLVDGTQIVVPRKGEQAPAGGTAGAGASGAAGAAGGPIHLNSASLEELETIPGVGPVTAQRIVDFREQNGPFRSVDELDAVSGIGPTRLEQMRELVVP
jgi:competence protein ComEA